MFAQAVVVRVFQNRGAVAGEPRGRDAGRPAGGPSVYFSGAEEQPTGDNRCLPFVQRATEKRLALESPGEGPFVGKCCPQIDHIFVIHRENHNGRTPEGGLTDEGDAGPFEMALPCGPARVKQRRAPSRDRVNPHEVRLFVKIAMKTRRARFDDRECPPCLRDHMFDMQRQHRANGFGQATILAAEAARSRTGIPTAFGHRALRFRARTVRALDWRIEMRLMARTAASYSRRSAGVS